MSSSVLLQAKRQIEGNLQQILENIERAKTRRQKDAAPVKLVAVTKRHGAAVYSLLWEIGLRDFGESYYQEASRKRELTPLEICERANWHFIGHLQRNKARKVLELFRWIHSVDSVRLLRTLDRLASEMAKSVEVFVEVNTSGETRKFGLAIEEVEAFFEAYAELSHVKIIGLMTMAPYIEPSQTRPYFAKLRHLWEGLRKTFPEIEHLSMGMSNDYVVAVEEGATIVRIGRALFEGVQQL